jgi:integrase
MLQANKHGSLCQEGRPDPSFFKPKKATKPVPLKELKKSFSGALKRAGIEDFRFHDLRHTFASMILMAGGGLKDVQELLGHKTMAMTLRYAHLSQEHKMAAVRLLDLPSDKSDTKRRKQGEMSV